jgi:hypothetical protein
MSGVEMLLGILVIQMFFLIYTIYNKTIRFEYNAMGIKERLDYLGAIYRKLLDIDRENKVCNELDAIYRMLSDINIKLLDIDRHR